MAVRGTSFMVTVEKNPDGSYNIYVNTFEGKVEVTLLDENGDPTDQKAFAEEGRGVTVVTEPNAGSGKPAEIDGISRFVYEDENGTLTELNAGDDPVHDIRYGLVPQAVKQRALLSHDEKLMVLRLDIAKLLRGEEEETEESENGTVGTSADGAVSSDVISSAEEEVSAVTAPPVDAAGDNGSVQTSAPIIEDQNVTVPAMVTVNNEDTGTYISDSDETVISDGRRTESSAKTSGSSVSDSNDETTDGSADGTVVTSVPDEYITEPGSAESGTTVPSPVTTHTSSYTAPYTTPRYTVPTHTTPTSPFIESSSTTVSTSYPTEDEKVYYQVRFICEGNIIASQTVEKNGTVSSIPAVPDKTGYNGSWHIGDNEFTADTIITADTNVTASYSLKILTATFKADADETFTQTVTVGYGNSLKDSLPAVPVKTGYVGKWYWNNAEFDGTTVVTANIIVEAVYTPGRCTVTITAADADTPYSETVTADSGSLLSDILPEVPTKTGYNGVWKINGTKSVAADTRVTSDITVKAVYTIQTFTVTITADADTEYSDSKTVGYGTLLSEILPTVPTKTGYNGVWLIGGTEAVTDSAKVTSDITVEAVYTIQTFTVTITADADTPYSNVITVDYGTNLLGALPDMPKKTGFKGVWKINGTETIAANKTVTSDISVSAEYTVEEFTVTVKADSDTPYSEKFTVEYGTYLSDILPEVVPTKTGYDGVWLIGGTEAVTDSAKVTSDMTVMAVYTIKTFTVTITADADTAYSDSRTVDYGTLLSDILPTVPTKTGHTGVWKINGTEAVANNTEVKSDMTVTAVYTINEYTVTFVADGKTVSTVKVKYNTSVKEYVPAVPEKAGYDGMWVLGDSDFDPTMLITEDITVTAHYQAVTYTVSYFASYDMATVLHTDSVGYGEVPPAYTPDTIVDSDGNGYYDYYLWGWESVPERSRAVTADTVIIVPYEDYDSINELRIKDGSTVLEHRLFKQGETITMPSPVSTPAEGYEFKGWGQVGSGGSYATGLKEGTTYIHETSDSEAEMMMVYAPVSSGSTVTLYYSGNIEFRAVYKPIELTVTMIADGDTPYTNTLTVDYGTAISDILPTDVPTKAGYTGKWTMNGSDIDPSMPIKSNITIIAEYTQNETDVDVGDPPDEPSEYMTETADLYIKQDQQDTPIEETE